MSTLEQLLSEVQAETTQIDGLAVLLTNIQKQLADALSGVTLAPAVQAKIDEVFIGLQANSAKLAEALNTVPQPIPDA